MDPVKNTVKYQASSPDELALVEGGASLGYKFLNRTSNTLSIQIWQNEPEVWTTHVEFPFDSSRKRMSVIVEHKGKFYLMTKGADSIMLPRCNVSEEMKDVMQGHLNKFAKEGLRTLVMGQKEISRKTFEDFKREYENIKVSNDKYKEKKLFKLYDELEMNLDLLGASAIEDKLQKGVPETIFKLMEADIRIWVLTGDKQVSIFLKLLIFHINFGQ